MADKIIELFNQVLQNWDFYAAKIVQLTIYGLQLGTIYSLIALGYTMVYGIVNLINFAHGDFLMIGAYSAFFTALYAGTSLPVALVCAMLAAGLIAVVTELIAYRPMRDQPKLSALVTALGVSIFIQNLCRALPFMGPIPKPFPRFLPDVTYTFWTVRISLAQIIFIAMAFVLMMILNFIVHHTKTGRNMRAIAMDRDASVLMGTNVNRIITLTFLIGGALAGAGGLIYSSMYPVLEVTMGGFLGNKAFVAAVVGGIGSIRGAMWGGIIMGLAEVYATAINAEIGFGAAYLILIIILLVKPAGLFGKAVVEKV